MTSSIVHEPPLGAAEHGGEGVGCVAGVGGGAPEVHHARLAHVHAQLRALLRAPSEVTRKHLADGLEPGLHSSLHHGGRGLPLAHGGL